MQSTIVMLLEHISGELERQQNLPSSEQVKGLEEDTAAKGSELEHAQNTQQHLQVVCVVDCATVLRTVAVSCVLCCHASHAFVLRETVFCSCISYNLYSIY